MVGKMVRGYLALLFFMLFAGVLNAADPDLAALRERAEAGNAMAQLNLGAAYDHAMGVARDIDQAIFWYEKAAEQGLAEAQFNLAHLLVEAEISPVLAAEWMARAAAQGMVDAQFLMGVIHAEGIGVAQNLEQARWWLQQAVDAGHEEARGYLEFGMPMAGDKDN
jgi:uncharacterized protein